LHDTPAKSLFEKRGRAFSHGCIRIGKPFDLAAYLLKNDAGWTETRIRQEMNKQTEKWVILDNPCRC
jgi:murein L,D-transpeptidase YcbB/YkuD